MADVAGGIDCILEEKILTTSGFILRRYLQVATVTGLGMNVGIYKTPHNVKRTRHDKENNR